VTCWGQPEGSRRPTGGCPQHIATWEQVVMLSRKLEQLKMTEKPSVLPSVERCSRPSARDCRNERPQIDGVFLFRRCSIGCAKLATVDWIESCGTTFPRGRNLHVAPPTGSKLVLTLRSKLRKSVLGEVGAHLAQDHPSPQNSRAIRHRSCSVDSAVMSLSRS
jgi:hypothetical protein